MSNGWVKLWRKSIDSGLIKNHNVWIFWTYCLMKANHEKDYKQVVGFQEEILQPGQFIFGRKKAALETGLSEQQIRTCAAFLKKCKNLTIKTTNKYSVITIINWAAYQNGDSDTNQQTNQHVTSTQPAGNHKQEPKNQRTKEYKDYAIEKIKGNSLKEYKTSIISFIDYRMGLTKKDQYKTTKGVDGLLRNIADCFRSGYNPNECLKIAMEEEWKTPDPNYFKNKNMKTKGGDEWDF